MSNLEIYVYYHPELFILFMGFLKVKNAKGWFAIPFSDGHFVRNLTMTTHLDGPYTTWLIVSLSYTQSCEPCDHLVSFYDYRFHSVCPLMDEDNTLG